MGSLRKWVKSAAYFLLPFVVLSIMTAPESLDPKLLLVNLIISFFMAMLIRLTKREF